MKVEVTQSCLTLFDLMGSPWDSLGQNTGVGRLALLQGIFPTQGRTQVFRVAGRFFTSWATREIERAELTYMHYVCEMHS